MDHAEAREQLLDLAAEPARLRELPAGAGAGSHELRAHLAACASCRADLDGWRAMFAALDLALGTDPAGGVPATSLRGLADAGSGALPADLRARTLAAAEAQRRAAIPVAPDAQPRAVTPRAVPQRRATRWPAWLAAAAAVVVLAGGVALLADRSQQLRQAQAETAALAGVTATLDRILQDPGHRVAVLTTPSGASGGSVSWSATDGLVAVLSTVLPSPAPGYVYRCWITQGGTSTAVGEMLFSGSTAYWAGRLDTWGTLAPGSRFLVTLQASGGGASGGGAGGGAPGTPALAGSL